MRRHLYRIALATALAMPALGTLAQPIAPATQAFALRLAIGDVVPPANAAAWLTAPATTPANAWQGRVYRLLQFTHLPTEEQKAALRHAGVLLFDYLPLNAYTASLPATLAHSQLAGLGLRSISTMPGNWKLAGALAKGTVPPNARRATGQLEVVLTYYPVLAAAEGAAELASAGFQVVSRDDFAHQLHVVLAETAVPRLTELPWVSTVEAVAGPNVADNFRGRTSHHANVLATDYGAGRHYDGRGVTVGHFDGGAIGAHIDLQGRLSMNSSTPVLSDHAAHTAGTILGAGNLEPRNRGQAVGAFDYYQYFNNGIDIQARGDYATHQVRVTSNSYGTPSATGYNSSSRNMDQQMRQLPFLLHVFSAGNDGTSNFNYGAGAGWGNISPGYQQGKNLLDVGALDYRDVLGGFSSRGPAIDGRLKPDVCGVGVAVTSCINGNSYDTYDGTSMSCPGVSGVTAQLIGAYRSLNGAAEAPGALLKAVLMNTAEDLGNPGPDFRYGYGRINGLRAVRALEGHTYFRDTLDQGQSRTFVVPGQAGKRQLRVMLYWNDYESAVNARPTLVNNLDLLGYVGAAGGPAPIQPWILDHRATVTQLNANAVRGRDSINNVEQITIDNPTAGSYSFTVSGRAVPQGHQGFWLTYSYIDEGVELTYPLGGEGFVPGETEALRWDAADSSLPFTVEYTIDNGVTYAPIASNVAGTARSTDWVVPALTSGRIKVRVTRGSTTSQSPEFFTVAPMPTNLRSEYRCLTESKLTWTASARATSYTVYKLGTQYMDSLTTVTTPFAVLPGVGSGSSYWFAVRARGANGLLSRRTRAIFQPAGARDCPGPPQVSFAPNATAVCPGITVALADSSQSYPTSWAWVISPSAGVTFVNGTSATSQNPRVQFANLGTYTVTLTATNTYGPSSVTRTNLILVTNGLPMAFSETFPAASTTFPPAGWRVVNPSSSYTWQLSPTAVMGPDNVSRRLPMVNNFSDVLRGAEDYLITPPLNLAGSTNPELTFAVAYRQYSTTSTDGLRVDISGDCGLNFYPTSYLKRGATLATYPIPTTNAFVPTSAVLWRQETLDLRPFLLPGTPAGQTQTITLRFVNLNSNGNNIYLANVRLAERVATATTRQSATDAFTAAPVPFGGQLRVTVAAAPAGAATLQLFDVLGREVRRQPLVLQASAQQVAFDTEALPAGMYVLRLSSAHATQQLKVLK